jgi:thiol:disulfide interchange protein DsbC
MPISTRFFAPVIGLSLGSRFVGLRPIVALGAALMLSACSGEGAVAATAAPAKPVAASAAEATIRKVLAERVPKLPAIDEVTPSPVPGLFEVRFAGTEIIYVDATGQFLLQGALIDTKTMANLTEQRVDRLTAVDFKSLPLQDALVFKQGDGSRKLAVFADPNCGYCKRFERDLLTVQNVTIYTFLMPILGPDSTVKSRDIWCAKDGAKAWRAWMVDSVAPDKAADSCKPDVLARNVELGRKHRINGTPALLFEDGTRKPGALPAKAVEELLAAVAKKS